MESHECEQALESFNRAVTLYHRSINNTDSSNSSEPQDKDRRDNDKQQDVIDHVILEKKRAARQALLEQVDQILNNELVVEEDVRRWHAENELRAKTACEQRTAQLQQSEERLRQANERWKAHNIEWLPDHPNYVWLSSGAEVAFYRERLIQADSDETLLMELVAEMRDRKWKVTWDAIDHCAAMTIRRGFVP